MSANDKLQEVLTNGIGKIEDFFGPLILSCDVFIGMLEENNMDASKYFNIHEGRIINYYKRRDALIAQRDQAIKKLEVEIALQKEKITQAEADAAVLDEGDENTTWDKIVILIIQEVVKNGVKIKVGDIEWESTKPLGGEGSVFDDLRNGTFNALGIDPDSELAKILKDPLNRIPKIGEDVNQAVGEELTKIKQATDKVLTDVKRETDKALTDIKKTTDKALEDVARETLKVLDDARKIADNAIRDIGRSLGGVVQRLPRIGGGFKW